MLSHRGVTVRWQTAAVVRNPRHSSSPKRQERVESQLAGPVPRLRSLGRNHKERETASGTALRSKERWLAWQTVLEFSVFKSYIYPDE